MTCTARRPVSRLRWFDLHLSRTSGLETDRNRERVAMYWTATKCRRASASLERQEAIEEAPSPARGDRQGCTECRRFPLRV